MDVFDITDFTDELTDAKNLLGLGIASPTMRKEVFEATGLDVPGGCAARRERSNRRGDRAGIGDRNPAAGDQRQWMTKFESEETQIHEPRPEETTASQVSDIRAVVQAAVQEFLPQRAELEEARKQRDDLERRIQELTAENAKTRERAKKRSEVQRYGRTAEAGCLEARSCVPGDTRRHLPE